MPRPNRIRIHMAYKGNPWQETWYDLIGRWTHTEKHDLTWFGRALNEWHRRTLWIRPRFWIYVLGPPGPYYRSWYKDTPRWTTIKCRFRGHPEGYVYYNFDPEAIEPDPSCKTCGEELY